MKLISQPDIDCVFNNLDNLGYCCEIISRYDKNACDDAGFSLAMIVTLTNDIPLINYAFNTLQLNFLACDNYGYTPLHLAAKFNKLEACRYLCEACPELIDLKTNSGYSVLHCAVGFANLKLITYLIESQRADIYSTSLSGRTIEYFVQNNPSDDVKNYISSLFITERTINETAFNI